MAGEMGVSGEMGDGRVGKKWELSGRWCGFGPSRPPQCIRCGLLASLLEKAGSLPHAMSSHEPSHERLSAASNDRKARLAQLKSLKRKALPADDAQDTPPTALTASSSSTPSLSVTTSYLSGRNFDPATRTVKLGFDKTPVADATRTLEYQAQQLALATKEQQVREESDAPLDLFRLQPKKANWDLKRDLEGKIREGGLVVGMEGAVARLVRERVGAQRRVGEGGAGVDVRGNGGDGMEVGMEGGELVEAMHQREAEEERERRREEVGGE